MTTSSVLRTPGAADILNELKRRIGMSMHTMLPGRIESYDAAKQ